MPTRLRLEEIPISSITVSPANVRKTDLEEGIDALARSIKEIGLQQPVVVYRSGTVYELIIGQRRFLACKRLGWEKIPALVTSVDDQTQAAIISFSENIHRLDLEYRDKMAVAVRLLHELKSVKKVAECLGVTEQSVRNYLGYEGVPEGLKRMVDEKKISASTAVDIAASVPDEKKAIEIAQKVVEAPSRDRRRAIVEVARDNPERSATEIDKLAAGLKCGKITLHLTPRLAGALQTACRDFRLEPDVVAQHALEEWLGERGFLK